MNDPMDTLRATKLARLEAELRHLLPLSHLEGAQRLNEALEYGIRSGGKRLRPLLALGVSEIFDLPEGEALRLAGAIEYLHLASVILDDLPAMDDARTRRHLPALHVVFGEAIATLAALSFYTRAFEILAAWPTLVAEAARVAGSDGMIGGQAADLCGAHDSRLHKTAPLIRFAVAAPARIAGAPASQIAVLDEFGELVGEAYQLCDDLLDLLAAESQTGKTSDQDRRHRRQSFTPEFSARDAYEEIRRLTARATAKVRLELPGGETRVLLAEFASWLEQQAGELMHGDSSAAADGGPTGSGSFQRGPLAQG